MTMKRKVKVEITAGDTLLRNMRASKTGELIRWKELTRTEQSQNDRNKNSIKKH